MASDRKFRFITRLDRPEKAYHAWWVRVSYQGKTITGLFPDGRHGGKRKSLSAAIKFRNQVERELGKPRLKK